MKPEETFEQEKEDLYQTDEEDEESQAGSSVPSTPLSRNGSNNDPVSWPRSYRQSMDMLTGVTPPMRTSFVSSFHRRRQSSVSGSFTSSTSKQQLLIDKDKDEIQNNFVTSIKSFLASHLNLSVPEDLSFPQETRSCTFSQSVLNGINVLCGVALLTMPYAVKEGGWVSSSGDFPWDADLSSLFSPFLDRFDAGLSPPGAEMDPLEEISDSKRQLEYLNHLGNVADSEYGMPRRCACGGRMIDELRVKDEFDTQPGKRFFSCVNYELWVIGVQEEMVRLRKRVEEADEVIKWVPILNKQIESVEYTRGSGKPTIVLEAVASEDLWMWHAFFGLPGTLNDINVLDRSPVFDDIIQGNKAELFAKHQESTRKDVERAFGVLQSRFAIVKNPGLLWDKEKLGKIMRTCVILHNMIVENERGGYSLSDTSQFESGESSRSSKVKMRESLHLNNMLGMRNEVRDSGKHDSLKTDLVENVWQKFGILLKRCLENSPGIHTYPDINWSSCIWHHRTHPCLYTSLRGVICKYQTLALS
uniref:Uncharacterized protein n=1 Tax=Brassica oleracea TaxID=3712 RepID=A0A3P5ZYP5_BRAOL|nr:unnamed protein product [Brassica oleracea]